MPRLHVSILMLSQRVECIVKRADDRRQSIPSRVLLWVVKGVLALLILVPVLAFISLLKLRGWEAFASMAPNEWGDLLAGIFGPASLAVLGFAYLTQRDEMSMQREELRNNTEALALQREELATLACESEAQNELLRKQGERADTQGRIGEWSLVRAELDNLLAALFREQMGHRRSLSQYNYKITSKYRVTKATGAVEEATRSIPLPETSDLTVWALSETPSVIPPSSNPLDEWATRGWDLTPDETTYTLILLSRYCTVFREFVRRMPESGFLGAHFFLGSLYADVDSRAAIVVRSLSGWDAVTCLPGEDFPAKTNICPDF